MWANIEKWRVIVYPFIDGDTSWTGMIDEQWKEAGRTFQRIHAVKLAPSGFESVRKETFDPSEYAQWVRTFEVQHLAASGEESASRRALRSLWIGHERSIDMVVNALEKLAEVLRSRALPYVICHADLHPANLLRDHAGHVHVIDWDEVMLAPKERDFLFIKASATDSEALPGSMAFFQGYGKTEIDWVALTYFRYERVIQDLIACAQEVFSRDDLGEETKADSVRLFESILLAGGEIEAAMQTSTYLPANLSIPTRMVSGIGRELAEREKPDW